MDKKRGDNDESVEISGGRGGREQQRSWKRSAEAVEEEIRGGSGGRERRLWWRRSAAEEAEICGKE